MKLTISRKELLEAARKAARGVSGRSSLPILNHLRIVAAAGVASVEGNDLEIAVRAKCPSTVETGEFGCTVDAKSFLALLSALVSESVTLTGTDNNSTELTAGPKSKHKLPGFSPDEYPTICPALDGANSISIDGNVLKFALASVIYAVGQNRERPILSGVYFDSKHDSLKIIATDTHQLALKELIGTPCLDGCALLPGSAASHIFALLENGECPVVATNTSFYITTPDGTEITCRLIDGQYPNYERFIPQDFSTRVIINRAEMEQAIRRVAISQDEVFRCVMEIGECVTFRARNINGGNAEESMEAEITGGRTDYRI